MTRLLIAVATVVGAVVLFLVLRPGDDDTVASATTATATTPTVTVPPPPPPPPSSPPPAVVRVTIRDGLPVGGVRRVTVKRGRQVTLVVTSDVSDHVHLHGYDVFRDVGPGMPARLAFRATIAATVEAELEERGVQIASITAQ